MKALVPLDSLLNENAIIYFDIGSRNGVWELYDLAPKIRAFGFEPNPVEFKKLETLSSDVHLASKRPPPKYRSLRLYPVALNDTSGLRPFYITAGPGGCTLVKPNFSYVNRFDLAKNQVILNEIEVPTETLEKICLDNHVSHIDYIKLDTEGNEYEILASSESIIRQTGVIKTEIKFGQMNQDQKVFADIDQLLRDWNFELLSIEFGKPHFRAKIYRESPKLQLLWGDAFYVNRSIFGEAEMVKLVLVLFELGFVDEALFILKEKLSSKMSQFEDIVRYYKTDRRILKTRLAARLLKFFTFIYEKI